MGRLLPLTTVVFIYREQQPLHRHSLDQALKDDLSELTPCISTPFQVKPPSPATIKQKRTSARKPYEQDVQSLNQSLCVCVRCSCRTADKVVKARKKNITPLLRPRLLPVSSGSRFE